MTAHSGHRRGVYDPAVLERRPADIFWHAVPRIGFTVLRIRTGPAVTAPHCCGFLQGAGYDRG